MLIFKYGVMGSSKTANLVMAAYTLEQQGKKILVLKPSIDTRSSKGYVESRVQGLKYKCIDINSSVSLSMLIPLKITEQKINTILIDECNFLTFNQVKELRHLVDLYNIDIICYGLKNTYVDGELFEGSKALLYYSDIIREIADNEINCVYCDKKAIMNLRIVNGEPTYDGETIHIGDTKIANSEYYVPTCSKHYYNPPIEKNENIDILPNKSLNYRMIDNKIKKY